MAASATDIHVDCLPFLSDQQGQSVLPKFLHGKKDLLLFYGLYERLLAFHITHLFIRRLAGQPENCSFCGPLFSAGG